jgi:hypothetical protein
VKRPSLAATGSVLVAVGVLAACGTDDEGRVGNTPAVRATSTASPGPSGTPTSAPTTPPTSTSPTSTPSGSHTPSSGHRVLTLADNGKTVALAVGQSLSVRLGGPWLWGEPVLDGGAIDVAQVNFLVDPGYSEWTVQGLQAGRATLQINGEANCPTEGDTVCILGAKFFALTFAVG